MGIDGSGIGDYAHLKGQNKEFIFGVTESLYEAKGKYNGDFIVIYRKDGQCLESENEISKDYIDGCLNIISCLREGMAWNIYEIGSVMLTEDKKNLFISFAEKEKIKPKSKKLFNKFGRK